MKESFFQNLSLALYNGKFDIDTWIQDHLSKHDKNINANHPTLLINVSLVQSINMVITGE